MAQTKEQIFEQLQQQVEPAFLAAAHVRLCYHDKALVLRLSASGQAPQEMDVPPGSLSPGELGKWIRLYANLGTGNPIRLRAFEPQEDGSSIERGSSTPIHPSKIPGGSTSKMEDLLLSVLQNPDQISGIVQAASRAFGPSFEAALNPVVDFVVEAATDGAAERATKAATIEAKHAAVVELQQLLMGGDEE